MYINNLFIIYIWFNYKFFEIKEYFMKNRTIKSFNQVVIITIYLYFIIYSSLKAYLTFWINKSKMIWRLINYSKYFPKKNKKTFLAE